jgi:hypothetical protein
VETDVAIARFDPQAGGMLSWLARGGSGNLATQTDPCCGNGMHFWTEDVYFGSPGGWITPQSTGGDMEILSNGPFVFALRSTGTRQGLLPDGSANFGALSFE